MPSASAKLEKTQASSSQETSDNNIANAPIRQALVIIEHKIRNLEKRKTKLESYRAIQASGKELSADQKAAVAKYNEVAQSLEFARDLSKQMLQLASSSEKEQKKQARREVVTRAQAETAKIREVLTIQNVLSQFVDPVIREDFLNGTNGAVKLEENDLKILEKFYNDIQVSRQTQPEDPLFLVGAQKAAEYLSLTIDGRPKQYGETTFENVRRIIQSIQDSGYLDKAGKVEVEEVTNEPPEEEEESSQEVESADADLKISTGQDSAETTDEENTGSVASSQNLMQQPQQNVVQGPSAAVEITQFQPEAPSAAAVPAPSFPQPPPQHPAIQQKTLASNQIPTQTQLQRTLMAAPVAAVAASQAQVAQVAQPAGSAVNPLHGTHFPPTTVRAVEQAYFKQHQYIQQMRPLAEVIGSANFFFLQESELDSPEIMPSGFNPNDPQATNPNIVATNAMPPQGSPSSTALPLGSQQQTIPPPQMSMPQQQQGMQQQNPVQPANAPIPSQTFTNQSFPTLVPASAIFTPQAVQSVTDITSTQPPQLQVFTGQPMPLPQLVAQSAAVVVQNQAASIASSVESQQAAVLAHANQQNNPGNLMTGPSGASVPLPGFPNKFSAAPNSLGLQQMPPSQLPSNDKFDSIQQNTQSHTESTLHTKVDDAKSKANDPISEWEPNESAQKSITTNHHHEKESNQWNNDVSNNNKSSNEWTGGFDNNQHESNTWNNNQSDAYSSRPSNRSNNYGNTNRTGGNRGLRNNAGGSGGGSGGPPSNGYRGRSNNTYQSQNGRNSGMYFRNNDNGYYQNQNGGGGAGGGGYSNNTGSKDPSGNSYTGGSGTFRPRGGQMPPSSRQQSGGRSGGGPGGGGGPNVPQPQRTNSNPNRNSIGMSTNPNQRPGRTNGGGGPGNPNAGGGYGSAPRPLNSVRQQQQDVNA